MDTPQRRSKSNNGITYVYLDEVENKRLNSEIEDSDKEEIKIDLLFEEKDVRYSPFLMEQIYAYWYRQGLFGIFLTDFIRIITLSSTMALCFFVVLCVDMTILFKTYSLVDSIKHPAPNSAGEYFFILIFTISLLVWLFLVLVMLVNIPTNYHTRTFFQKLMGSSRSVTDITWTEVVAAIKKEYNGAHDELDIVNAVMVAENFMLALINEKQLGFQVPILSSCFHLELMTMALERGLKISIGPLLDKIKRLEGCDVSEDKYKLKRNLITCGIVGLFLSPITVVLVLVFVLLEYGEQFKNSPGQILGVQDWSLLARYKFRDYNELPHLFEARMKKTYKPATEFFDNRTSHSFVVFTRFISFQLSSIILFLLLASFYDSQFLTETKLIWNMNALMVIGGLGTALAALRRVVPSERTVYEPKKAILDLSATTHYYPKRWIGYEHADSTFQDIKRLYPYSFVTFFWELLGIFIAPLQMLSMSRNAEEIVEYLRDNTTQLKKSALYSKHSCFQKTKAPHTTGRRITHSVGNSIHDYPYKVVQSMINFKMEYPSWIPPVKLQPFFDHTDQIHSSTLRESFQEYTTDILKEKTTSSSGLRDSLSKSSLSPHFTPSEKQKESFSKSLFGYRIDENLGRDQI